MLRHGIGDPHGCEMKKDSLLTTALFAFGALLIVAAFFGGNLVYKSKLPEKSDTTSINASMAHEEVVEELGVLYDSTPFGDYEHVDRIAKQMDQAELVDRVSYWRLSDSKETFWVGFDDEKRVVSTLIK